MTKNVERGRATRQQLVEVATRLFSERGYEGTSIEAVLRGAGVSRGSLYHHFGSKDALFEAALITLLTRTGDQTVEAARGATDALSGLRAGCLKWVRLVQDPGVYRIMLIDGPSVLGWQRWRELDQQQSFGVMQGALRAAAREGRIPHELVDMFAHALLAAIAEIALVIALAPDRDAALRSGEAAVDQLLSRVLSGSSPASRSGSPVRPPGRPATC